MKNVVDKIKNYPIYLGIFFLVFSLIACSDDDDGVAQIKPTGFFEIGEEYDLTGNTITLESITVGQDSWLVAVNPGEESSNNFISDPVMLDEGVNTDVELTFDEGAISDDGTGQEVVLKLYADHQTLGIKGEWDAADQPITGTNNALMTETITVFAGTGETAVFADFDTNNDGNLDRTEVPNIYQNNFAEWDTDDDNLLNQDEFNTTTFSLTDMNDDDGIDTDEWDMGFASFFGNWNDDDFATFDADSDGILTSAEWNEAFAESDWFGTFDSDDDDMVGEAEWDEGLFGDWDTNDDDMIDEDEFNVFSPFAMNW